MNNSVSIKVNGKSFSGWKSVSISCALTKASRSFSLSITNSFPNHSTLKNEIGLGDLCEVWIGDDKVLTGYIESMPIQYNAQSIAVSIAGRSKTADIVDCFPFGFAEAKQENSWSNAQSNFVMPVPQSTPNVHEWRDTKLETIVSDICAPYGVKVVCDTNTGDPIAKHVLQTDETCFESIARLLEVGRLFAMDDADGNLVIAKAGSGGFTGQRVEVGSNVLAGSMNADASACFSDIRVEGQSGGSDLAFGAAVSEITATAKSNACKRYRLLKLVQSEPMDLNLCNEIARYEASREEALLKACSYEVAGWRTKDGQLWTPNTLVRVKDFVFGLDEDMLLAEVRFSLSNDGGMTTKLKLAPVAAFRLSPLVQADEEEESYSWISEVK